MIDFYPYGANRSPGIAGTKGVTLNFIASSKMARHLFKRAPCYVFLITDFINVPAGDVHTLSCTSSRHVLYMRGGTTRLTSERSGLTRQYV